MARVEIRLPEEHRATVESGRFVPSKYYEILIDGRPIHGLVGATIEWSLDGIPTARLDINVNDLEIDAVALGNLRLHLKAQDVEIGTVVKLCRDCGKEFVASNHRWEFCPPDVAGSQSPCMKRFTQREYRAREHARKLCADGYPTEVIASKLNREVSVITDWLKKPKRTKGA